MLASWSLCSSQVWFRLFFDLAELETFPGGGGWLDQLKLRLTQPQVELEAWAELGKNAYFQG